VGLLSDLLGRSKPKQANLDALFSVPDAAITLQASMGLVATGDGAVCYRAAAGVGFATAQDDVVALLGSQAGAPRIRVAPDEFGFTWLEVDHDPPDPSDPDVSGLCTDLHAVNTALESAGFGPALLCSLVPFTGPGGQRVGLVYLYKQGTFYPFVPIAGQRKRDNLLEINVRDALKGELPLEPDLDRWLALWGAPGL
jgi:hypothetical protein